MYILIVYFQDIFSIKVLPFLKYCLLLYLKYIYIYIYLQRERERERESKRERFAFTYRDREEVLLAHYLWQKMTEAQILNGAVCIFSA